MNANSALRHRRRTSNSSSSSSEGSHGYRGSKRILDHTNALLGGCESIRHFLPLSLDSTDTNRVFYEAFRDGTVFCELIGLFSPDLIHSGKIHRDFSNGSKKYFLMLENQALVLHAAEKLGCKIINVGPSDLADGKAYLILAVLWQIIKFGLIARLRIAARDIILPLELMESLSDEDSIGLDELFAEEPISHADEADNAIMELLRDKIAYFPRRLRTVSDLITDIGTVCRLLVEAGADEEQVLFYAACDDHEEQARKLTAIGRSVLGDICMIEPRDFVMGNNEMIVIFLASILEKIIEKKKAEEEIERNEAENICQEEMLAKLKEENERLRDENDALFYRVAGLDAEIELMRNAKVEEDVNDSSSCDCSDNSAQNENLLDDILRQQTLPDNDKLDWNSINLRKILHNTTDFKAICQAIYGDLTLGTLLMGSDKAGILLVKDRRSSSWRKRFLLLRDNFIFIYRKEVSPKDKPVDIVRIDDALVRVMFEVQNRDDPVISVEIASKVMPFYLYLSGPAADLNSWKGAISQGAAWWLESV